MGGGEGLWKEWEVAEELEIQRSWFTSYMETNLVVDPFMAEKEIIVHKGKSSKLKAQNNVPNCIPSERTYQKLFPH